MVFRLQIASLELAKDQMGPTSVHCFSMLKNDGGTLTGNGIPWRGNGRKMSQVATEGGKISDIPCGFGFRLGLN